MGYFLFFAYLLFLSWLLTKINFIKNAGIAPKIIIALFVVKVLAGVASGWMVRNDINSDTWGYHKKGVEEYQLLFTHPQQYFTNLFHSGYKNGYEGVFQLHNSYWNDLKTNLMVKIVSLLEVFSGGHYYVNAVLYNFIIFFGCIALFRVFSQVYKGNTNLLIITCFLLPSTLLFSSTVHKDGIILMAISFIVFCFYHALHGKGFTIGKSVVVVVSLASIFLFRSFVFIALLPALAAWFIAHRKKYNPVIVFTGVYFITIILFFTFSYLLPAVNLPQNIVQKQADFLSLERAKSYIDIHPLYPSLKSFAANMPQAAMHSLLRPYLTDYRLSFLLLPFAAELFIYQLVLIALIFFSNKILIANPFILCCIFFSLTVLLITGYTVPVIWAIVRYRSIYLPFLLTPVICAVNWESLKAFIYIKK